MIAVVNSAATPARFTKVSDAGLLLPVDATDWVAVYDRLQELVFTRKAIPGGRRAWKSSVTATSKLDLCGWTGQWRAPSRIEIQRLIDDTRYNPALDTDFFTVADDEYWNWTGTRFAGPSDLAWAVSLGGGLSLRGPQSGRGHVRAVCPSQCLGLSEQVAS